MFITSPRNEDHKKKSPKKLKNEISTTYLYINNLGVFFTQIQSAKPQGSKFLNIGSYPPLRVLKLNKL